MLIHVSPLVASEISHIFTVRSMTLSLYNIYGMINAIASSEKKSGQQLPPA